MVPKTCCFRNLGCFFHLIVPIAFVKAYGKCLVCSGSSCQIAIITRTAGQQFVVVSIFHGFVVDFSVPFLVTLFCSI